MNKSDLNRNAYLLQGSMTRRGYMRWWHSFTGIQPETGEKRTFFIEYLIMNPGLAAAQPILTHRSAGKKRAKPCYFLVKAGVFPNASQKDAPSDTGACGKQLHAFYPVNILKIAKSPLILQAEDCFYSENRIYGSIYEPQSGKPRSFARPDTGYMEWKLEVHKAVSCHTGFIANPFFTALNALRSFWHGEGIRTFYRGSVVVDNTTYEITPEDCYGYADKHWGRGYSHPWLQLASCRLVSEKSGRELKHSALAADGCSSRFLWFPLRQRLTLQLTYNGEDFEFHFARPGSFSRSRWKIKTTGRRYIWHITAQNKNAFIKVSGACRKEEMLPLRYQTPDGSGTQHPVLGGGAGHGTIWLYRLTPEGKQLIDTLSFDNALFLYQA